MKKRAGSAFDHIRPGISGHFVIYLYAAVYRLVYHILKLSEFGGANLEEVFKRYPFLAEYFREIHSYMPDDITWNDGAKWWEQQVEEWQVQCKTHLPLRSLRQEGGLNFESRLAFMITGLVEEDSRFGTIFAELLEPLSSRRPTLELVGQMLIDEAIAGEMDPWTICRPLIEFGLVESHNREAPRSEWVLKVPPLLWDAVRGEVEAIPADWCTYRPAESLTPVETLIIDEDTRSRLKKIPELVRNNMIGTVVIRSVQGANVIEVMGAVARSMGRSLVSVDSARITDNGSAKLIGPVCILTNAIPVFQYELSPGETVGPPVLNGYRGPIGIALGLEGGLTGNVSQKALTLTLPALGSTLRRQFWLSTLNNNKTDDLDLITQQFRLPGDYIRQTADIAIAHAKLDGKDKVHIEDVRTASRTLNRQMLDTLASHIESRGSWNDIVAVESTTSRLRELQRRCHHREDLLDHLGPAFDNDSNCGVRALFTGASGTGKTLAAKILAAELRMDLYRVDLAAIINKYIGETEKNLHRVLSRAEALDVIILLDEGDALLGSRTDVKSANDRYANIETNYLLQRLENYHGIVFVTTNMAENVDRAFQRRMDVVVPFLPPQAEQRLQILELHLPEVHSIDYEYLRQVALRCSLTGGQIRNAVLQAMLLALDDGSLLNRTHLEEGVRSEFKKAGATFPMQNGNEDEPNRDDGMDAFVSALRDQ